MGCFAKNGSGRLHKIDRNANAHHYLKIFKHCAVPSMQQFLVISLSFPNRIMLFAIQQQL